MNGSGRRPPDAAPRRLFLDVSELAQRDARTGVQRVTRSILLALIADPPAGVSVVPVYATTRQRRYRQARRFLLSLSGWPDGLVADHGIVDAPVRPRPGDVFFGLDLLPSVVAARRACLDALRGAGVAIYFFVHDLLPVTLPHAFPPDMAPAHAAWLQTIARYDGVICNTRAVADELVDWLDGNRPPRDRPLAIAWSPGCGADLGAWAPTRGLPEDAAAVLARLAAAPSFLSVATLEPRKAHAQMLAAFERLWAQGHDANLVFVGKAGWMVEDLLRRLADHPERGRRLFWLAGASDEYLDAIYGAATCLLAASEGEGFGLPLIEAARHGLPILARDIPVFREVAGEHAAFFSGRSPADLADAVEAWLGDFAAGRHPRSDELGWITWRESAAGLARIVLDHRFALEWAPPAR